MSPSNAQSCVPPGFRFYPTEEELLHYYLRKKIAYQKIDLDVIRDVDLNKLEPWDIQEKCKIGSGPQNDWYFFSHKDKKYPTGTRTNRATAAGFWKATGRDKIIYSSFKRIGMRKTLVFYKGRAPHGQKSDWIMHEYRLDDQSNANISDGDTTQEDGWVVCRVFKKKTHQRSVGTSNNSSPTADHMINTQMVHSTSDGSLDQILQYMGRACKQEPAPGGSNVKFVRRIDPISGNADEKFMQLPPLKSPKLPALHTDYSTTCYTPDVPLVGDPNFATTSRASTGLNQVFHTDQVGLSDWATLDRLVASQLNGQVETSTDPSHSLTSSNRFLSGLPEYNNNNLKVFSQHSWGDYNMDVDSWTFARQA